MSSRRRQVIYCEMCGAPIEGEPYVIYVEGAEMYVCERCYYRYISRAGGRSSPDLPMRARLTGVEATARPSTPPARSTTSTAPRTPTSLRPAPVTARRTATTRSPARRGGVDKLAERYEVVPDYAERVRRARERLGLSQEELAIRVKERVNVIKRIEAGTLVPTVDLARRLEKVLGVKLLEPVVEEDVELGAGGAGGRRRRGEFELTLGDIVEIREE